MTASRLALVDTDVLIDYGRDVPAAVDVLASLLPDKLAAVSVVTYLELLAGCRDKREQAALDAFMAAFVLIHIDESVSNRALELMRRYRLSHGLRLPDALIAACALAQGLTLVSKNQKDYRFIDELDLPPYPAT
ncbi:type II toxin-antitoxin system VapC family toxin [Solidesulfovibrio sp.]|uniref:type II toxin-antitoxin system VapC family toxin n=1 Tax=Solidesulfovibrio sp. TaxID=2910990 RepID=UPI002638BC4B|nr:type II toxin-antitoxin system VapC family toxin [Solidesulfovibrio sp.]